MSAAEQNFESVGDQGFEQYAEAPDDNRVARGADPNRDLGERIAVPETPSLLDEVLSAGVAKDTKSGGRLQKFLDAQTVGEAIEIWLGDFSELNKTSLSRRLNRHVAKIERLLNSQFNAIIHHVKFQKLEASWRGIKFLQQSMIQQRDANGLESSSMKLRIFDCSWKELERDFDRAIEFDQSQIFKKVYEEEFGKPGGTPYGLLIGDYQIHPRSSKEHPHDDITVLGQMAGVAAASFCPFITGTDPSMFGLNDFSELEIVGSTLERGFNDKEFIKWRALRESADAKFVGLAMPQILMRTPYDVNQQHRSDGFLFKEVLTPDPKSVDPDNPVTIGGNDRSNYLWGNAAFAYAEVVMRSFAASGWMASTRGVIRGVETGGIVTGLPVHSFGTDSEGVAPKCSTDVIISEHEDSRLANLGFLPLCHCHDTSMSAFYTSNSAHKPPNDAHGEPILNAKISGMLHYVLCSARFAHYLKSIVRNKIGSAKEADTIQKELERWIRGYVTPNEDAKPELKARKPLRQAEIEIKPDPRNPGQYLCVVRMMPHYQLDDLSASVQLRTKFEPISG